MAASSEVSKLISRTIEIYNRYRSPEVKAKLLSLDNQGFTIEFEGIFCQSCGVVEYFEDFIFHLKSLNKRVDVEIQGYEQIGTQSLRVRYVIKSSPFADDSKLFVAFLGERGLTFGEYEVSNACAKDVIRLQYKTWLFEKGINEKQKR